MRVTPDASLFTAMSRDMAPRRRDSADETASRQAFILAAYDRTATVARPVTRAAEAQPARRQPQDDQTPASRREAPLGQRPKFIPKGQTVDLLV